MPSGRRINAQSLQRKNESAYLRAANRESKKTIRLRLPLAVKKMVLR